jgi:hypothetical protein
MMSVCVCVLANIKWFDFNKRGCFLSLKYNQQNATFSRSTDFYKLLYMFQAVPPPIIRSTKLYVQCQVYLTLSVRFCAPDDERRNGLKHVEQFI